MSKEEKTFPKEWYNECLDAYQEIKDINLKGDEFQKPQKGLKEIFKNGRKPKDVIATMEYLEEEKSYDWSIAGAVKNHIAEGVKWKSKREKKEKAAKNISFKENPSLQEVEDFYDSFEDWKDKSSFSDSPWAFEFYLHDAGVIQFSIDTKGEKHIKVKSPSRYEEAYRLYDELKKYEDEQIEGERIESKIEGLRKDYEIGKEMP